MSLEDRVKVTTHTGGDVIKVGGHIELNLIIEERMPKDRNLIPAFVKLMEEQVRLKLAIEWARLGEEYLREEHKANEDHDLGGETSGPGLQGDQ
jgi:hypothetical protein